MDTNYNTTINTDSITGLFIGLPFETFKALTLAIAVAKALLIVLISFAVMANAQERRKRSAALFLLPPWLWFFTTLCTGGFIGAFGYWLIHYSSIGKQKE
jgi:hypothetical protein